MAQEAPKKDAPASNKPGTRKKIDDMSKSLSEKKSAMSSAVTGKKQKIDATIQDTRQSVASAPSRISGVMGKPDEKGMVMLGGLRSFAQITLNAALTKSRQPAELLAQKQQQAQAAVQTANAQVDSAKKIFQAKETAHTFAQNQANQQMNEAVSFTSKAKQGIEDRQRELTTTLQMVQSLRSQLESQVSSASQQASRTVPGEGAMK